MPNPLYIIFGSYIGLSIVYIIVSIIKNIEFKKSKKKYLKEKNKYIEEWKQQAQIEFENSNRAKQENANRIIADLNKTLELVKKEIKDKENFNSSLLKIREEELDRLMAEKKARALSNLRYEIDDWAQSAQEAAAFQRDQIFEIYQNDINKKDKELSTLQSEIEEYRTKRNVINEEILRRRAVEEQQDFYSIQIPDSYKHDLALLDEIRHDFSKIDILDKLIYDNYIKKPVDEMIQRVLNGRAPSGIYKITRLKTGEVYIGRSTDIKTRFQQHCKSCYHCGVISRSKLHTVMENDGIWNFTFELLEEVPKDKLNEREKYWIDFYESKKYGLNEKAGG